MFYDERDTNHLNHGSESEIWPKINAVYKAAALPVASEQSALLMATQNKVRKQEIYILSNLNKYYLNL